MGNEMSTVNEEVNEYIDDDGGVGFGSNNITGIAGNTKDINNASNTNDYLVHNAIGCSDSNEQLDDDDEDDVILRNPPCNPSNKEKVMVLG